eukprot:2362114-Pyramimonas_sp.AAC.1
MGTPARTGLDLTAHQGMALHKERRGGHIGPVEPFRPTQPQLHPVPALRHVDTWLGPGRMLVGVGNSLFSCFDPHSVKTL